MRQYYMYGLVSIFIGKMYLNITHTVNCHLQAPGLYNYVRGFRWACKRRGLYPRGLITGKKNKNVSKLAIAVLIEIRFSFTGF